MLSEDRLFCLANYSFQYPVEVTPKLGILNEESSIYPPI